MSEKLYAFPRIEPRDPSLSSCEPGMPLRDWLAGQALPAIIAAMSRGEHSTKAGLTATQSIARDAYDVADAMLAERTAP